MTTAKKIPPVVASPTDSAEHPVQAGVSEAQAARQRTLEVLRERAPAFTAWLKRRRQG